MSNSHMSYANVASHHTNGPQPQADPTLLNTKRGETGLPDVEQKVTVVPQSYKIHPETETSVYAEILPEEVTPHSRREKQHQAHKGAEHRKDELRREYEETKEEGIYIWEEAKERILRPGVMGGLVGLVNVGLLGAFGYQLYTQPRLRSDTRYLATAGVSGLVIMGAEGYVAESYRETPEGQARERRLKEKARKEYREARQESLTLWEETKERVLRPGTLGGLVGLVNVGLIGAFGYQLYTRPALRTDTRALTTAGITGLVLLGGEGFVAESYRRTAAGQEEERRAREEGAAIWRHSKQVILQPGVLGGLVGLVNLGVLGGVGYVSYLHWDEPVWDRRTVSAVTVGLVTLFTGEGFLAEQYADKGYPKRK